MKRYWKSLRQRDGDPGLLQEAAHEFPQELDRAAHQLARRDFLKLSALTATLAGAAGCSRAPVEKAIPFLVQPEEIVPGRAYFYSTTCGACSSGCGVITRNRDGRPVKLEGNPEHPVSRGGLCAGGQASILGLYDSQRYRRPRKGGRDANWPDVDREIMAKLDAVRAQRGAVRFLSATITSPTLRVGIAQFQKSFADARHITYDALSSSAILAAHQRTHGIRVLPRYHFDRAEVIISIDADFLCTWISPVEFTAVYGTGRTLDEKSPRYSYHLQFESRMSLTGSKADERIAIAPHDVGPVLSQLVARIAPKMGVAFDARGADTEVTAGVLDKVAERLWQARGRSLIVSGSNQIDEQVLVNFLNHLLGNYGATLDITQPSLQRQGNDAELNEFLHELRQGSVKALLVLDANPVYELPGGPAVAEAIKRVPLVVSFAQWPDETAALAHYVCPDHHYLESWADTESVSGVISVRQPAIRPLGDTRPVIETLAAWAGKQAPAYELLRASWQQNIFPRQKQEKRFELFWDRSVERGFTYIETRPIKPEPFNLSALHPIGTPALAKDAFALVLYPKVALGDGRHAYNPWLQELPDPITKITWDNYACLSPTAAKRLGVEQGNTVVIETTGEGEHLSLMLPVVIQPGQHEQTVAVALGYGSVLSRRFADIGPEWLQARPTLGDNGLVGKNAAPLLQFTGTTLCYTRPDVKLRVTPGTHRLACTQEHFILAPPNKLDPGNEPRAIVQETTLAAFVKDPVAGKAPIEPHQDLWPADHPYTGYRWGMTIDLSACTGCSACVIACQAENNIPVVGRDEVYRKREMHWLRIDRYYAESAHGVDVAYQPMLCQQCENAPCETVCPVLATVHSAEGLNQQVYNRCVGTRYCANNCAYKTRRFNWFDYVRDDRLQNLVLNPDVTVRTRGIMEKCTFCVQRIQEAKIEAKRRGEKVKDGEIQTACQQSCPATAIVFGDLNDPDSRVSRLARSGRAYRVLEELNVRPSVSYLTLVRNREQSKEQHRG